MTGKKLSAGTYFGTTDAANVLGVTTGRIRQLVRAGELRAIEISPHVWVFPEASVRNFKRVPRGPKPKTPRISRAK